MRSRVGVALVSALGSVGVVMALAAPAAAATGPPFFSTEQAGYVATGARFQAVQSSVLLPNAANFATEVAGFGVSAQLWTPNRVVIVGVSNTTTAGNYFAAVAVFNRNTHALICSTAATGPLQCPNVGSRWTDGSVSFAPGDDMTLTVIYDRAAGRDHFFVDDNTSGVSLSYGGYVPGTGKNYTQARVGAEFAADPWSTFTYTAPAAETHLVTFHNSVLVTYSGHQSSFSSWWTHHKILATSNGTSAGIIEVRPHNLFNHGANFGVFFEH
jgi:hypothetical protein